MTVAVVSCASVNFAAVKIILVFEIPHTSRGGYRVIYRAVFAYRDRLPVRGEIGRASCRERV